MQPPRLSAQCQCLMGCALNGVEVYGFQPQQHLELFCELEAQHLTFSHQLEDAVGLIVRQSGGALGVMALGSQVKETW